MNGIRDVVREEQPRERLLLEGAEVYQIESFSQCYSEQVLKKKQF